MNDKTDELSKAGGDQADRQLNAMWGLDSGLDKECQGKTGKLNKIYRLIIVQYQYSSVSFNS